MHMVETQFLKYRNSLYYSLGMIRTGMTSSSSTMVSGKGLTSGEVTPSCRQNIPENPGLALSCIKESLVTMPSLQVLQSIMGSQVSRVIDSGTMRSSVSRRVQQHPATTSLMMYSTELRRVVSCTEAHRQFMATMSGPEIPKFILKTLHGRNFGEILMGTLLYCNLDKFQNLYYRGPHFQVGQFSSNSQHKQT